MKKIEIDLNNLWEILSECIKDQQKDKPEGMASLGERLFNQYHRERSKREDYNYKCLELDGNSSVDFVEIKSVLTKSEAEKWVEEKPHLRTWHEFVDAVL